MTFLFWLYVAVSLVAAIRAHEESIGYVHFPPKGILGSLFCGLLWPLEAVIMILLVVIFLGVEVWRDK